MKIGAALLTNNVDELLTQIVEAKKCDFIQIDVMDGTYTSEQTVWVSGIKKAMAKTKLRVELHLMINDVSSKIDNFIALKPDTIFFHIETQHDINEIVNKIKAAKIKVGVALAPKTSATVLRHWTKNIDSILLLGVTPGKQGQKFNVKAIQNIAIIREYNKKIPIEMDGGITPSIARLCRLAGATACVSGSYLQEQKYSADILEMYRDA